MQRPERGEYPDAFAAYIDLVPDGDVLQHLERQAAATCERLGAVGEAQAETSYAPGKWSIKRVVQHVVDGERLFCYRALCIARGEQADLPGFDENLYASLDGSGGRTLVQIVAEFRAVRAATLPLFRGFDGDAWRRRGRANGRPVSVRSLPWILAGHELHHLAVLSERYRVA